jgi:small subunit ribosomal protein S8
LKYHKNQPVITGLERASKSSCRYYVGAGEIPRVRGGLGVVILSTPDGVISGKEARRRNVGGEVLCKVW